MSILTDAYYEEKIPSRRISATWDHPDLPFDDEGFVQVVLSVHHDKERKRYYAALARQGRSKGFITAHIAPGEYMTLLSEPAQRYSLKKLREFFDLAVAYVEEFRDTNTKIQLLMEGQNFLEAAS